MYKTKINNEVKNYDSLLEAKMSALMSFKKNKQLVEVLDEEDNVVFSKSLNETKGNKKLYKTLLRGFKEIGELENRPDLIEKAEEYLKQCDEDNQTKDTKIEEDYEDMNNDENIIITDLGNSLNDVQPTEEQIENAFESIIRSELSKLFTTIDDYNSDVATLTSEEASQEVIDKLNLIIDDLNTHVGILQSCLDDLSK